jgi:hypothetical protein
LGQAEPAHPPPRRPPSSHMRSERRVSLPCRGNGLRWRRFRSQTVARFTTSGNGSAKSVPSAASGAARSG